MGNTKKGKIILAVAALGVVFGDIGTSPLYALQAVFGPLGRGLQINTLNIHGIISLIIWSVTIVVSVKYVVFLMRADNEGEGGIIALIGLIKNSRTHSKYSAFFIFLGLVGLALFYGDSVITPAISVLSAVEGVKVVFPHLESLILPATAFVLAVLFWIQKYGTGIIGRFFGPVMLLWFLVIGIAGAWQVGLHPEILAAVSPLAAIDFFVAQPFVAFIAMSAVMLTITGAEALYADMGHFGRPPISRAWFFVVFPALMACYMGQGALLLADPEAISNPLVLLFPEALRFSVVILATLATLIASQSVISGAFSLTRQAVHLNFLPKMMIRHTSNHEAGQVYLPFVNFILFVSVTLLVFLFGSSQRLAGAYGMAVSITLAIDTVLFVVVVRTLWKKSLLVVGAAVLAFLTVDMLFVASNISKILHGGWFPLAIATLVLLFVTTWIKGQKIVSKQRMALEGSLTTFVEKLRAKEIRVARVKGSAVYIGHHEDLAPLALHATIEKLHELHEKVVIVSVRVTNTAHVSEKERAVLDTLGHEDDGISHVVLTYGFHDLINVPKALKSMRGLSTELDFNPDESAYFVSHAKIVPTKGHNMARWRKSLYALMARNATRQSDYYKLPTEQTVEMSSLIKL
jgi:KUP system potassium uptake protein